VLPERYSFLGIFELRFLLFNSIFITGTLRPLTPLEQGAFSRLQNSAENAGGSLIAKVTGPLKKSANGLVLEVREFSLPEANPV
jgi:hypothetical protein